MYSYCLVSPGYIVVSESLEYLVQVVTVVLVVDQLLLDDLLPLYGPHSVPLFDLLDRHAVIVIQQFQLDPQVILQVFGEVVHQTLLQVEHSGVVIVGYQGYLIPLGLYLQTLVQVLLGLLPELVQNGLGAEYLALFQFPQIHQTQHLLLMFVILVIHPLLTVLLPELVNVESGRLLQWQVIHRSQVYILLG